MRRSFLRSKSTYDASAEVTYPESTALKTQHLPKPLSQSLRNLFSGYPSRSLKRDGLALRDDLVIRSARHPNVSTNTSGEQVSRIRNERYAAVLFAATRMPSCYAATRRVFHEIACREPAFKPQTLLDFGSGVGTTVWAAHSLWGGSIKEFQCIDSSNQMNEVAASLLRSGKQDSDVHWEDTSPHIGNVYFKQFMPMSDKVCYDIVVSAYTLEDIPTLKLQTDIIRAMWKKASKFLVIIESGTVAGFHNVLLARDTVLNTLTDRIPDWPRGHVFAPCTHDLICPHRVTDTRKQCKFGQRAELSLAELSTGLKALSYNLEKFSYIVLMKGERSAPVEGVNTHRIVEPERKRTRHVVCKICTQDVLHRKSQTDSYIKV
ncbi:methyltransferase-like protein 17, mitochondrial isoform X2 [Corticium candelabrum]|uniref:methyltransferase-like protein 17, mitochondrial isoform X2 n=1 Tax=Corticium candelabrum TaxID=121492 RepID=UPI002E2626FD|nr:methyltransferase-like protein 17, mitochondrial isoform X2 [Corticium candelabrum]